MLHRVRAPPICTLGYAAALSKSDRAFASRDHGSNRAARTTGAKPVRTLETSVKKSEEQGATEVFHWACRRWKTRAGGERPLAASTSFVD